MISVTVICYTIQLPLVSPNPQIDFLSVSLGSLQVLSNITYFLSILIKKGLSVGKNFIDFVIHLTDLSDILVIIVLNYIDYCLLLFIKGISNFVYEVIRLLNQLSVQLYINALQPVQFPLYVLYLVSEYIILHLLCA